jgi:hypothetical protein
VVLPVGVNLRSINLRPRGLESLAGFGGAKIQEPESPVVSTRMSGIELVFP